MCDCTNYPFWHCKYNYILIRESSDIDLAIKNNTFRGVDLRQRNRDILDFDIDRLLKLPSIRTVYVNGSDLTEISIILKNINIKHIWLQGDISLTTVLEIVNLNQITSLAIKIYPDAIKMLSRMTSLHLLLLGSGWLDKSIAMDLCKISSLIKLDMTHVYMCDDILRYIYDNAFIQTIIIKSRIEYPKDPLIEKACNWLDRNTGQSLLPTYLDNKMNEAGEWISNKIVDVISPYISHILISSHDRIKFTRAWPRYLIVRSNTKNSEIVENTLSRTRSRFQCLILDQYFPTDITNVIVRYDW